MDRSEFELLEAWRQGDGAAGQALLERQFDMLYRFFRTKAPLEDVQDLIQATLLRCLEHRDDFAGRARFSTYVFALARSVLVAHYRERERQNAFDPSVSSVADVDPTPSSHLARQERLALLLQALRSLPLDAQVLLALHHWEKLTGPELARILEVPEGTVRTRLRRARQSLREALDDTKMAPALALGLETELDRWAERLREHLDGRDPG